MGTRSACDTSRCGRPSKRELGWGASFPDVVSVAPAAKIVLLADRVEDTLPALLAERDNIERELGFALDWESNPSLAGRMICVTAPFDIRDRSVWPLAIDWLVSRTIALRSSFGLRITNIANALQRSAS